MILTKHRAQRVTNQVRSAAWSRQKRADECQSRPGLIDLFIWKDDRTARY